MEGIISEVQLATGLAATAGGLDAAAGLASRSVVA